ncbi:MAG: dienelactone hydrolase family protein [Luteolibacter sp.]
MKPLSFCIAALFSFAPLHAALVEEKITYQDEKGATLEGFHVYDDAVEGKRPGVLVIHQWLGLTDYEMERSRQLAQLGYNVFAADIYGKGIRPDLPEAGKTAGTYKNDRALFRTRLKAGLDWLTQDARTDANKIAAIGYCFGGTGVLELARSGAPVSGVVSFHGGLDAKEGFQAEAGKIPAKVLCLHGAADPYVKPEEVAAFDKEMTDAKADWQLVSYGHAVHSFTQKHAGNDPSKGAAYNESADLRSWEAMKAFFVELFGKP